MAAIEAIVFAVAAGFAFVIVISIIVIIGVHQEERYLTLEQKTAPSVVALLARIVLGRYVRKERDETSAHSEADDHAGKQERSIGPNGR
jgi:hypothetical protein